MTITVDPLASGDGDFTVITAADNINASYTVAGEWTMASLNTASQVEGSGCTECTVRVGIGTWDFDSGANISLENQHLYTWAKLGQSISAAATYGARNIIGEETNHGSWVVYDSNKQVIVYNGWMRMVNDPRKPFDNTVGTAPTDIIANQNHGIRVDFVDANGKTLAVADAMWRGSEVSIEGGTTGARGTLAEWVTADRSGGYGLMRSVGGVFYMNSGAVFQGVGTADSYFEDSNQLIIFEDLPVSGSHYKFRHVGNSTGTNHWQLGTVSGTGVDEEGAGGGVMRSAGAVPFRIEAIDANIDAANYYGVTMQGPTAPYADQFRNVKVEDNGTGFTDISSSATGPLLAAVVLMPATQALNDATYYGHDERFYSLNLNLSVAKGGTWTGTWEYHNGTAWVSLTDVTDGTSNYATTGAQTVTYAIPDDWAANAIDSDTRYWVRFRISSFTSSGTNPTHAIAGCTCDMAGDVEWQDPLAKIIGGSSSGMGSYRVRNGAFLKKHAIDASNVSAKHAAVDLGSVDPPINTVRDLPITNSPKGVLLKDYTRFFNAGAAVDKGAGKVGIPSTAHGFPAGQEILIAGTTNYNGVQTVDATSTANEIVITDTFVSETFSTTDSAVPNTTFNIRGFTFIGNTKDFRIDYPATSTVNINLLDGTSSDTALTPANQDNVNSSTVNIINALPISVTATAGGSPEAGASVYLKTVGGTVVLNGVTNASGVLTGTYSGSTPAAIDTTVSAVRSSSKAVPYQDFILGGSIEAGTGYTATALLSED